MIDVTNLKKSYGITEALRGVSFHIGEGEIVGLLGPNGAGKTTIIKILTGYLQPDEGTVEMSGLDVLTHAREIQAQLGYLPETAPLYPELSVQAYLRMMADLRQIPEDEQLALISEAVHATHLENQLARRIGELSKGFRQRVGLAQAILHHPKLLILDEPTLGLDPTQIVEIRNLIRWFNSSKCGEKVGTSIDALSCICPHSLQILRPVHLRIELVKTRVHRGDEGLQFVGVLRERGTTAARGCNNQQRQDEGT